MILFRKKICKHEIEVYWDRYSNSISRTEFSCNKCNESIILSITYAPNIKEQLDLLKVEPYMKIIQYPDGTKHVVEHAGRPADFYAVPLGGFEENKEENEKND